MQQNEFKLTTPRLVLNDIFHDKIPNIFLLNFFSSVVYGILVGSSIAFSIIFTILFCAFLFFGIPLYEPALAIFSLYASGIAAGASHLSLFLISVIQNQKRLEFNRSKNV